jgi:hypothetical protein
VNNSELDDLLRKARTPEPPEEFWEAFPQQMARRANRARTENFRARAAWFPRLAWGAVAVICVLAVFAIAHWRGQQEIETPPDILANVKLIRETLAMFPDQVRAIVEDGRGLHLILANSNNVPVSTPLYVRVCHGKQWSSVVTFSGQEIEIAGQKLTVLSDGHGGIILEGNRFVWSSEGKNYAEKNVKIEARSLGESAL